MPSSPQGPCSSGNTTSTSPRVRGTAPRSCTTTSLALSCCAIATVALEPSTSGSLSAAVIANRSGSPDSSTQRPSWVMPTGTTS